MSPYPFLLKTVLLLLASITAGLEATPLVIPLPRTISVEEGARVGGSKILCEDDSFRPQVEAFVSALGSLGAKIVVGNSKADEKVVVTFVQKESIPPMGYEIRVSGSKLLVGVSTTTGVAHAAATLLQSAQITDDGVFWPAMTVKDQPEFGYRSFMVDMGRNPHSPKTLRHVVDMMWFYKANFLHLHLTDDQLFSWPSKAYPKLQSQNAGWTYDDFVALEVYSQARGVTIIPELDVPGHSSLLRGRYPEVFGKDGTELASSPAAQKGIETLISEMLGVFKATPYFHIGADEAHGVPTEMQRDFINRLNKFVKSQGRRTVVWEGPRLGKGKNKVDEDVLHINWETIYFPAPEMLAAGYEVVNAGWDPFYIVDHYPRTMFTAVDLKRCYGWDPQRFGQVNHGMPTFANPHRAKSRKGILGFCMPWWEGREENILPLCLPRLAAATAGAWNRKGEDDFESFLVRQAELLPRLEKIMATSLPRLPFAQAQTQDGNLAFRGTVKASVGAHQPHFGPGRLTNGLTDRFDHFLGFPTTPKPLEIVVAFKGGLGEISRIVVHETAVGGSHEIYELLVSRDGKKYQKVGESGKGTRGEQSYVEHRFDSRDVEFIKVVTKGCHGLTFPSFSRLCEIQAYAN